MKTIIYIFVAFVLGVVAILGFRGQTFTNPPLEVFSDMKHQLKYKSQSSSEFFADHRSDREQVPGTVPFALPIAGGILQVEDAYLSTGMIGKNWGDGIPLPVNQAMLLRGQERYEINCALCHGALGNGAGIISKYGFSEITSYHTAAIRNQPDGQIFNTISKGKGRMGPYPHISLSDRWAIVAYVRVLQRSQSASDPEISAHSTGERNE